MSRRRLRSEAKNPFLPLPDLSTTGTIPACNGSTIKREHELGKYALLRSLHYFEEIGEAELKNEFARWLEHRSCDDSVERVPSSRQVHETAVVDDLTPVALTLGGTDVSQGHLISAVNTAIRSQDWHELWVLLAQIRTWYESLHNVGVERPWWMLQDGGATSNISEVLDLAAHEEVGGCDKPINADTSVERSAKKPRPIVKEEEIEAVEKSANSGPSDSSSDSASHSPKNRVWTAFDTMPDNDIRVVDAIALIQKGGSWRSYAYFAEGIEDVQSSLDTQRLISKDGTIRLQAVGMDEATQPPPRLGGGKQWLYDMAACDLSINIVEDSEEEDDGEENHGYTLEVTSEGGSLYGGNLDVEEGFEFKVQLPDEGQTVKVSEDYDLSGNKHETPKDVLFTTMADDLELHFHSPDVDDYAPVTVLLRKETDR